LEGVMTFQVMTLLAIVAIFAAEVRWIVKV
jgi:hypothetical protein